MITPEKMDVLIVSTGPLYGQSIKVNINPEQKLREISGSYFRDTYSFGEESYMETEFAVAVVLKAMHGMTKLPVATDSTQFPQWVVTPEGNGIKIDLGQDLEQYLSESVGTSYNVGTISEDDMGPAGLTVGMGLDFHNWLNRQIPAIEQEFCDQLVEKAALDERKAKFPTVSPEAALFAVSSNDWIDRIYTDALTAFETGERYVEVFDKAGLPITIYRFISKGSLNSDPDFEGYTQD